jgi:tRNA1(Val) A37 N6-methylase TrmN6
MLPEGAVFDLVTGTSPYLRPGTATEPRGIQRGPCHFEQRGGVEEYCAAAARLVAPKGRFVTCAAAAQVERVVRAAAMAGMVVERRRDVIPREGKGALFSVYCLRRASEVDEVSVDGPLIVRDANWRRTPACIAMRQAMGMPP